MDLVRGRDVVPVTWIMPRDTERAPVVLLLHRNADSGRRTS